MKCIVCGSKDMDKDLDNVCVECAKKEKEMWKFYSRKIPYNGKMVVTG